MGKGFILDEILSDITNWSCSFFDEGIKNNSDFKSLSEKDQLICKSICVAMLVSSQWLDFCKKVNGWKK